MSIKKNWFTYLSIALYEVFIVYALYSAVISLADSESDRFLWFGSLLGFTALVFLLFFIARKFLAHSVWSTEYIVPERVVVVLILALSALIRLYVIQRLPIAPASDYNTYYQVAVYLSQGKLGASSYIALFPHVIGYPYILSLLFRITGPSVRAGLYLNLAASLLSVYLIYRIARILFGRFAGLVALMISAFYLSQIVFGAILASEPIFTCMILLDVRLFIFLYTYPRTLDLAEGGMTLSVALGVLTAFCSAVRPMAEIFLIASMICLIPGITRFSPEEKLRIKPLQRLACQGWFRATVMVFSFLVCSQLISLAISKTVHYPLPGGTASFGYNLMVGVNKESEGTWNQTDADFLAREFNATNSPQAAHQACIGVAVERIKSDPSGMINLALEKYKMLWGNDNYAAYWTKLFLGQQGNLTPERQNLIDGMMEVNNAVYVVCVSFSSAAGLLLFKKREVSPVYALLLLFIGTVILHMALESQNRYHYFVLPVFILLTSMTWAAAEEHLKPKEHPQNSRIKKP